MKKLLMFTVIILFISGLHADNIFPGMYGDSLIDSVIKYYKSYSNQGYDDGRDILYGEIDNHSNYLTCVYSGYEIYLDPSADPSSDAYNKGINCEHTWPQSLGASGIAKGDLHHLYPTEIYVNGDRGNLPFAEINDNNTDDWYYMGSKSSSKPASNIDLYSERDINTAFEPREDHKGNVCRSMFYFYTMYRDLYIAEDPGESWWNGQKDDLFMWHYWDEVDNAEITRTNAIASYQENKANPFVLDTTLIRRAYYPHLAGIKQEERHVNVEYGLSYIIIDAGNDPIEQISIYDIAGRNVYSKGVGSSMVHVDGEFAHVSGTYIVFIQTARYIESATITVLR